MIPVAWWLWPWLRLFGFWCRPTCPGLPSTAPRLGFGLSWRCPQTSEWQLPGPLLTSKLAGGLACSARRFAWLTHPRPRLAKVSSNSRPKSVCSGCSLRYLAVCWSLPRIKFSTFHLLAPHWSAWRYSHPKPIWWRISFGRRFRSGLKTEWWPLSFGTPQF